MRKLTTMEVSEVMDRARQLKKTTRGRPWRLSNLITHANYLKQLSKHQKLCLVYRLGLLFKLEARRIVFKQRIDEKVNLWKKLSKVHILVATEHVCLNLIMNF